MRITFNDVVAQLAHVGWGGWMPFLAARLWFVHTRTDVYTWPILVAATKEIAESLGIALWESKQPWLGSAIDFAFFLVGICITYLLYNWAF